jgi:hypothetical protein
MQYEELESMLLDGPRDNWATSLTFDELCSVGGGYGGVNVGNVVGCALAVGALAEAPSVATALGAANACTQSFGPAVGDQGDGDGDGDGDGG